LKSLRQVGLDEVLTAEQGQQIREAAVFAARRQMIARKLLPIKGPLGAGVQVFGYDALTEVSDARIDLSWPGGESRDIVNLTRSTVAIPNIHKETEINKLDLAASRMSGTPLNLSNVESVSYKVALLEDALIINGWSRDGTNYDINGLYQGAGLDESTSLDWGTKANIETSINNAVGLMLAQNITPPYNLTLHPTQYGQTLALIASTSRSYRNWIREAIEGGVFMSAALAAGNGLLSKANTEGMFEYVLAEDLSVYEAVIQKSGNLFVKVYVRGIPVIYDANALCKLSAI
jgi:uncharacterized linocin/CFP29 family protein